MAKAIDFKKVLVETVTLELTGEEASTLPHLSSHVEIVRNVAVCTVEE